MAGDPDSETTQDGSHAESVRSCQVVANISEVMCTYWSSDTNQYVQLRTLRICMYYGMYMVCIFGMY